MVLLVTHKEAAARLKPLAQRLCESLPSVAGVLNSVAEQRPGALRFKRHILLQGRDSITERLCGLTFLLSPESFFQTHPDQAEVLYRLVREAAGLRPSRQDVLLDLYCGTGTIGLSLAHGCKQVVGYDIVGPAVKDAKRNAAANRITNATFRQGDLERVCWDMRRSVGSHSIPRPDVVIVDPARAGLGQSVVDFLRDCGARRVVYVSCNDRTLARDLDRLCNSPGAQYQVVSVQPVDMFPHTEHVEVVAVLDRISGGGSERAAA